MVLIYIAIIDDDITFLNQLYNRVLMLEKDIKIDKFSDAKHFLEKSTIKKYDLLFLDIDMPNISGLEISSCISKEFDNTYIIFITNREDLVLKAFNRNVIGFVPKSNLDADWLHISERIISFFNNTTTCLNTSDGSITLLNNEILYFERELRKIYLYTIDYKKFQVFYPTIQKVNELIDSSFLFQINRSIVVNINHIIRYDYPVIKLKNCTVDFYLTKNRRDHFIMKYLKNRMG